MTRHYVLLAICSVVLLVGIGLCGLGGSPLDDKSIWGAVLIVPTTMVLIGTLVSIWWEKREL